MDLDGGLHGDEAALGTGNRAADDEHVELGVDLDDLKVLDGDSLHTVLAGADLALEDTAGVGGGAHGTGVTVDRAAAVGHTTAAGVPALDNAGVAVTLARTGDVNEVAGLEGVSLDDGAELELGAIIKADTFKSGDFVDVTGTSKGHGYTGVIKRWNASRGRMTHGGGPVHRHAGSMGSTTDPSRIFKGKIGPGQYGVETVTIQNLEVVKVDPELNMLVVRGAVPGPKGSLVTVKTTVKVHKIKQAGADISKNPQKASGRNPQKASARNM